MRALDYPIRVPSNVLMVSPGVVYEK